MKEAGKDGTDGRKEEDGGGGGGGGGPGTGRTTEGSEEGRKEGRRMTGATDNRDHHRFDNSELYLAPLVGRSSMIPDHLVGHPLTYDPMFCCGITLMSDVIPV